MRRFNPSLTLLLLLLLLLLSGCAQNASQNRRISVIFRLDDYSATSNTAAERQIIAAFASINKPFTVGVIPFRDTNNTGQLVPLSGEKSDLLKEGVNSGIIDLALHGYSHQQVSSETQSEFATMPLDQQIQRISSAKKVIEEVSGQRVATFIPPWNTYDENTVIALEKLGFRTLSAGRTGLTPASSALRYLPLTTRLPGLKEKIALARQSTADKIIEIVLFHEYDFIEVNPDEGIMSQNEFAELLNWVNDQPDVQIISLSQARQLPQPFSIQQLFAPLQRDISKFIMAGSTLNQESLDQFRQGDGGIPAASWSKAIVLYGVLLGIGSALVFVIVTVLFKLPTRTKLILLALSALASIAITVYTLSDGIVYKSGATIIALFYSLTLGLLFSLISRHRHKARNS